MRLVLLPQAIRLVVPSLVTQLVAIVKDSTIGYVVSYPELMKQANTLANNTKLLLQAFVVVSLIYVAINFALTRLAVALEARIGRAGSGRVPADEPVVEQVELPVGGRSSLRGCSRLAGARLSVFRCRPKNDSIRPQACVAASGSGPTWAIFISGRASTGPTGASLRNEWPAVR